MKSYGVTAQTIPNTDNDYHLENIRLKGYSIEPELLSSSLCDKFAIKLEEVYKIQEQEFGKENLMKINELDIARMPFMTDRSFIELFTHPLILELAEAILGKHFHLHLQNGIINRPNREHHQASWHRDLPYQDWVISKPLGFNAFFCLTEFSKENGATVVLPYSHRSDFFPSTKFIEANELTVTVPKGSVIFFDSMLYHRASHNSTKSARYGINNMFVVPILKQQIDIPNSYLTENLSAKETEILGFSYATPKNVLKYREKKLMKKV